MTTEVGTKYDEEKPDFSLIDAEWLEEVAKVMTFGKQKYAKYGECTCHVRHVTLLWDLLNAESGWKKHSSTCPSLNEVTTGAHNWRKGLAVSRLLSAALRHLWAVVRGEDNDAETGLSHLAHLGCCAMFAYWTLKYRTDLDDRYKNPHEETTEGCVFDRELEESQRPGAWKRITEAELRGL